MTPEEINVLPEPVRSYIHDLETNCDPSGNIQKIASLTEQRDGLVLLLEDAKREIRELKRGGV